MAIETTPRGVPYPKPGSGEPNNPPVHFKQQAEWIDANVPKTSDLGDPETEAGALLLTSYGVGIPPESVGAATLYHAGTDDTPYIVAAMQKAAAVGGYVQLRRNYNILSTAWSIDSPVKMSGVGGMWNGVDALADPNSFAGLVTDSATANGLVVNAKGVIVEDFSVINRRSLLSPPTAGAGLVFDEADHFQARGIMVYGFYDLMSVTDSWFWHLTASHFYDPVRYGLFQTTTKAGWMDHNDNGVTDCVFAMMRRVEDAAAAWRHEGGAGVRWTGNKVVGQGQPTNSSPYNSQCGTWDVGLDICPSDGNSTGEFEITGGATSNAKTAVIRVAPKGPLNTGSLTRLLVTGHTLQGYGGTNTCVGIVAGGAAGQNTSVRNLVIGVNHWAALGGGAMDVHSATGITISDGNSFQNVTGYLCRLSGGTDTSGNDTRNVTIGRLGLAQQVGNEVQSIVIGGSGLTSFTLTFSGQTTASIDAAATPADVQAALAALSNIGTGNVAVSGQSGGPYLVTFRGDLRATNVAQMTATPTGGTGTVTVATKYAGGVIGAVDDIDLIRDERNLKDSNGHHTGSIHRKYERSVDLTVVNAWTTLFSFRPVPTQGTLRAAGTFKLELTCDDSGGQVFYQRYERGYYATGSGGQVFMPTIGTDISGASSITPSGTPRIAVQFDATSKPGWVLVQARLGSGGSWVSGKATLDLTGHCSVYALGLSPLAV